MGCVKNRRKPESIRKHLLILGWGCVFALAPAQCSEGAFITVSVLVAQGIGLKKNKIFPRWLLRGQHAGSGSGWREGRREMHVDWRKCSATTTEDGGGFPLG